MTSGVALAAPPRHPAALTDPVTIDPAHQVNVFTPLTDLGMALDGAEKGEVNATLTPYNIERMQSADVRRVTYRTRPELGIEVWHWTEHGTWSDPAHSQGYWTGDDTDVSPQPKITYGYNLPRRGDTIDNANNAGYSRVDDADPATFWKSNPYLDPRYTGLPAQRPEWIVLSFENEVRIDAGRILWAAPFARHFLVQYWDGKDAFQEGKQTANFPGQWRTFEHGDVTVAGEPSDAVIRLSGAPVATHFLRILMMDSSGTALPGSTDPRDHMGFAVREVSFGLAQAGGGLADVVRHAAKRDDQTVAQVSSTDPWHRAVDKDLDAEQPSLEFVFSSGLAGGLPLMIPVGVFYDTPENAAAEMRYVRRRGWPVTQVEAGEEADGQFIRPEDYADLYLEVAKVVHGVAPGVAFGGPSMEGALTGTWPDEAEGKSWMGRFVAELTARGQLDQFQFFSFEHYVFDDVCGPRGPYLRQETVVMDSLMDQTAAAAVPKTIPWIISEYGFSPFADAAQSELASALLATDIVGHFLTRGGNDAYMFGYPPDTPANQIWPCAGYGNMMLYEADDDGKAKWPMPSYYALKMMFEDWAAPADAEHQLFTADTVLKDDKGRPYVVAYPLKAPDGYWAVMLINRDEAHAHRTPISFATAAGPRPFAGNVTVTQYSAANYTWIAHGEASHPGRDLPPTRFGQSGAAPLTLPAMSLTVVSGAGP